MSSTYNSEISFRRADHIAHYGKRVRVKKPRDGRYYVSALRDLELDFVDDP